MGCCQNESKVIEVNMDKKQTSKPDPIPFAIMRNGHEVIRGLMVEIDQAVKEKNEFNFSQLWKTFKTWMIHHANMEDGVGKIKGFFVILNEKFNNCAINEGLISNHVDLETSLELIDKYNSLRDFQNAFKNWPEFRDLNERHLKAEEDIMMPKVQEMHKLDLPIKKILVEDIVSAAWDAKDFGKEFVEVACWVLEKHHGGAPRARVFLHALKVISDQNRWNKWLPFIKSGLSKELYSQIDSQIDLSTAGN